MRYFQVEVGRSSGGDVLSFSPEEQDGLSSLFNPRLVAEERFKTTLIPPPFVLGIVTKLSAMLQYLH